MDNYTDMFADLETFDGPEVFRQMQEKQKEEESKMLGEKQTMPAAAEAVPALREEKTQEQYQRRGKRKKRTRTSDKTTSHPLKHYNEFA